MILNVLLKRLLARFSTPKEVYRLFPGRQNSDWLATWRNTAYLEAAVVPKATRTITTMAAVAGSRATNRTTHPTDPAVRLNIVGIDRVDHLQGLKKTRGGIGSAKFDTKQKTVDSFFKSGPRKDPGPSSGG
jgi:hypothetical protein